MATITSNAVAGNWSAAASWVGGVVPTAADDAVIVTGATITIDANVAVRSITTQGTGTVALNVNSSILTIPAGGFISLAPSTTLVIGYQNQLRLQGAAASPCAVRTTGGASGATTNARIDGSLGSSQGAIQATYTDFQNLGWGNASTTTGIYANPTNNLYPFTFDNCTFNGTTVVVASVSTDSIIRFSNCAWSNTPAAAACLNIMFSGTITGTGQRLIDACSFDQTVQFYPGTGGTITRNYFAQSFGTTDGAWAQFSGNLCRKTVSGAEWPVEFDADSDYWLNDHSLVNPHGMQPSAARDVKVTNGVFEYTGTDITGDAILLPSPAVAQNYTLSGNVKVANASGNGWGTLTSMLGNANVRLHSYANTDIGGGTSGENGGSRVGEPGTSYAGTVVELRDNLEVSPSSGASGALILYDIATTKATDVALAANVHHNAIFNGYAGSNGTGYNGLVFSVGTPGTGDVNLGTGASLVTGGPRFVDPTRNLARWGAARQGADGTVAGALAKIAADRTLIADAIAWVRGGFIVQSPALATSSSTGGVIGAMAYQALPAGGPFPFFTDNALGGGLYTLGI